MPQWQRGKCVFACSAPLRRQSLLLRKVKRSFKPTLVGSRPLVIEGCKYGEISSLMVAAAGLEPTAHSLGNCCSILMSYAANLLFDILLIVKWQEHFVPVFIS